GVAQEVGAELLIDQDAGGLARHAALQRRPQPVIDDPLAGGDRRGLFRSQGRGEAEQPLLERSAMIEGQDVERPVISNVHLKSPLLRFSPVPVARGGAPQERRWKWAN